MSSHHKFAHRRHGEELPPNPPVSSGQWKNDSVKKTGKQLENIGKQCFRWMSHACPVRKLQISGFEPALRWPPHCDSIMVAGSSRAHAEELWDGCLHFSLKIGRNKHDTHDTMTPMSTRHDSSSLECNSTRRACTGQNILRMHLSLQSQLRAVLLAGSGSQGWDLFVARSLFSSLARGYEGELHAFWNLWDGYSMI